MTQRNALIAILAVTLALSGKAVPIASGHPVDLPSTFVWEGHWTASWEPTGAWRITERADFTVTVAFGGRDAIVHSSGTATLRVVEFQSQGPCQIQIPLPSAPMTLGIKAAVRWARPSSPVPTPGIGEMQFFIEDFTPIIVRGEVTECDGRPVRHPIAIPSLGTTWTVCPRAGIVRLSCQGGGILPRTVAIHGLTMRDAFLVEDRQQTPQGVNVDLFRMEIEAHAQCPLPGREAWVHQRSGGDLNSATINGRPAFDLGAPVQTSDTVLATDDSGILGVRFADLSEVWLGPSSRLRISGATCGPDTGMQIFLIAERGRIEILHGGHLGGGIGYLISPVASSIVTVTMGFHPEDTVSF